MSLRVWVDLTNSPHVLVLRPVIERLRAQGADVQVTARDFAQTRRARRAPRARRDRRSGRHRGARLGAKAIGLADRSAALHALGARAALRPRARPRLQRRHGRRAAAAHPVLDDVRLRVGDGAAHRQLPPRAGGRRARGDPAGAPGALRRDAQAAPLPGPQGGVLPRRPRARRRRCSTRSGSTAAAPLALVRTPPEVSLYHRFENDLFGAILVRLREQGQVVVLPRTRRAARGAAGGGRLRRPRARDRRAVAGRARRTSSSAPAAR